MSIDGKIEIFKVESIDEILFLSELIHKFFESEKKNLKYTESDFYERLPAILETGVLFYAIEDFVPKAYIVGWRISTIEGDCVFILQAYSERAFMLRRLRDTGDKWCRENNIIRQIMIVDPEKENFFMMHYQMKREAILMSREVNVKSDDETKIQQEEGNVASS